MHGGEIKQKRSCLISIAWEKWGGEALGTRTGKAFHTQPNEMKRVLIGIG